VISSGLQAGESIVVNGLQRARPGKPVTPQRGEMPILQIAVGTTLAAPATGEKTDQ
jgi:multidrug efflux system membrane fusion protein